MREIQTRFGPVDIIPTKNGEMLQTNEKLGVVQYGLLTENLKLLKTQTVTPPPADKPLPRRMRSKAHRRGNRDS